MEENDAELLAVLIADMRVGLRQKMAKDRIVHKLNGLVALKERDLR